MKEIHVSGIEVWFHLNKLRAEISALEEELREVWLRDDERHDIQSRLHRLLTDLRAEERFQSKTEGGES